MNSSRSNAEVSGRQARPTDESMAALGDAIARLNADGNHVVQALTELLLSQNPIEQAERAPQEVNYLVRSGALTTEEHRNLSARVARGDLLLEVASSLLSTLHSSVSAESTASYLKIDATALQRAVDSGELYAVEIAGRRRFPAWQFSLSSPGKLLPHLAEIITLVKDKPFVSVSALMSTPQATMVTHAAQTPTEWFRNGGGIEPLREIMDGEGWS